MYRIGIDVGSTYTKYCIRDDRGIVEKYVEKTPVRQKVYFEKKTKELYSIYPEAEIISCGYGKLNVNGIKNINELSALAKGVFYCTNKDGVVLDIGGQDTKIIFQEKGKLRDFFVNDKCAAGSGLFFREVLESLNVRFQDIDLLDFTEQTIHLSATCAVFAQSEIVELIADNRTEQEIIKAVICQILTKAKPLLGKVQEKEILLSGGLSQIKGIVPLAEKILGTKCFTINEGQYLSAIGCTI